MVNIMTQLPNHLIMDIIKLADGGLNTHKQKFKGVMDSIEGHGVMDYLDDNIDVGLTDAWESILSIYVPMNYVDRGPYSFQFDIDSMGNTWSGVRGVDNYNDNNVEFAKKWVNRLN